MKKFLVGFLTLAAVFTVLPMFAAFEAHVINVTARIENALSVPLDHISFGTVFPQEHLDEPLDITLSGSFAEQDRVDNVSYFIRQKPKCALTWNNGKNFDHSSTATGHIILGDNPATPNVVETSWIDCGPAPVTGGEIPTDAVWGVLPSLCEYISKEADTDVVNDETLPSFHKPWTIVPGDNPLTPNVTETSWIDWNDTDGFLTKNNPNDRTDHWTIDLAVPCFGGYCAQDWHDFVHGINPDADPAQYTQPIANEHKIFGCDLWVEVDGVTADEELLP